MERKRKVPRDTTASVREEQQLRYRAFFATSREALVLLTRALDLIQEALRAEKESR